MIKIEFKGTLAGLTSYLAKHLADPQAAALDVHGTIADTPTGTRRALQAAWAVPGFATVQETELLAAMRAAAWQVRNSTTIGAIKFVREALGCSHKEAKDLVELAIKPHLGDL